MNPALADRIAHWMMQSYGLRRLPTICGGVLAMVVDLAEKEEPFPQREAVAAMLGCSKFSVDAVLSTSMERNLITLELLRTADGNIAQRRFIPSPELLAAVRTN